MSGRAFELVCASVVAIAAVASVPFWWKSDTKTTVVIEQREAANAGSSPVLQQKATGHPIQISIASSNTKQAWLHEQVAEFQKDSLRNSEFQVDGRAVTVEILQEKIDGKNVDYRSGTMVSHIVSGKIKPTVASPGEPSWIKRLNKDWRMANSSWIVRKESPVLVRTPTVVAMWQSRAQALGCWPEVSETCTWERISDLAVDPRGWGALGRSEWGLLKLGYGYFGESNSGTLGIISMCMTGAKKTSGLQLGDVSVDSGCGKLMEKIEYAKVHSGKSGIWLLEKMIEGGPEYLDAVITYESNVIRMNTEKSGEMREPLVSVYPGKRAVVVGHPFAILDGAPWVTSEQVAAAEVFRGYLLRTEAQQKVLSLGMRGADPKAPVSSPIELAYGANPATKIVEMDLPDTNVIEHIEAVWHRVKKKSVVVIVFDKSGSMRGSKMAAAVKGAQAFVSAMELGDTLLWMPFDSKVYESLVRGTKADIGERLVQDIASTAASGETALYEAVRQAASILQKEYVSKNGTKLRYGIVVLSDGADTTSKLTLPELETILAPSEADPYGIQIHTICIGSDCVEKVLMSIAKAAHGKHWKGNTVEEMISVYQSIATHY